MEPDQWPALVPELTCTDLAASRRFYCDVIGFSVRFERPEDAFVYLELGNAHLMLEQVHADSWVAEGLDPPFGRGMNLQIEVAALAPIIDRIRATGLGFYREPAEAWYRDGDVEYGQTELLVQDPDGYLLRLVEVLGERSSAA
ncbi:VOC family protein [Agrobacterium sp. T29]|uniref:bleomycin resistance protein n=1 Tax=Agrobacterium sp. T29 TaxID=2580515 RepID=UPI00115CE45B|nr:VOC family protein [Agrobacterium sp. T29]